MYKNGGGSYAIDGISSQPQLVEKDLEMIFVDDGSTGWLFSSVCSVWSVSYGA